MKAKIEYVNEDNQYFDCISIEDENGNELLYAYPESHYEDEWTWELGYHPTIRGTAEALLMLDEEIKKLVAKWKENENNPEMLDFFERLG